MDTVIIRAQQVLFYLLVFFLPYIEVPFLKKIFVLRLSNDLAILAGLLLARQLILKKIKLQLPLLIPLALFLLACLISSLNGLRLPLDASGLAGATGRNAPGVFSFVTLFWMVFAVGLFWLAFNIVNRKDILVKTIKVSIVSAAIVSLYGIWTVVGYKLGVDTGLKFTEQYWLVPRVASTALEPLFFANYLLSILPLAMMMYLTGSAIFSEYLFLAFIFIQLVAMFMTFSTTAWLGFAMAVIIAAVILRNDLRADRIVKLAIPVIVFACVLAFIGYRYYPRLAYLHSTIISKYSNTVKKTTYDTAGKYYKADFVKSSPAINSMLPGSYHEVNLTVRNAGTRAWADKGPNPVQLTYLWINPRQYTERNVLRVRTCLPREVKPGETVTLGAFVRAPLIPGKYQLQWDMIEEYVNAFQDQGRSRPLAMEVDVSGVVQGYAVTVAEITPPLPGEFVPGKKYRVNVKLRNTGTIAWEANNPRSPVRFGYRWFNEKGMLLGNFEPRVKLPYEIKPGGEVILSVEIVKPEKALKEGFNILKFDMVREGVIWFAEQNTIPPYYVKDVGPVLLDEYRPNVYTVLERWWLWRAAVNMFREHPVLGVGLGNYTFLYNRYKTPDAIFKNTMPVVNNQYLEILVETGALGACAFLFFVFSVFLNIRRAFKRPVDPIGRIILVGLTACLFAMAIQLNFFCGKVLHYLWITLGLAFAAINVYFRGGDDGHAG
ncbi:MAG: hypothetical protein A2297_08545 [Elusimicrobia bacterium RIFOXYB2_FULL_48_7]|nr:MAG: hypothetical protein A2297_08545 [Elusimicrobia bacterium RIFOXYB2_FULL_48_7]